MQYKTEFLGRMPIMVLSEYCLLYEKSEKELQDLGECLYDQGGYFIINGGEKVGTSSSKSKRRGAAGVRSLGV